VACYDIVVSPDGSAYIYTTSFVEEDSSFTVTDLGWFMPVD